MKENSKQEHNSMESTTESITQQEQSPHHPIKKLPHVLLEWLENNSFDAASVVSEDGRILYTSPGYEKLLGYRCEELLGEQCMDYFSSTDHERLLELLSGETGTSRIDMQMRKRSGKYVWVEARFCKKYLEELEQSVIIAVTRDISDKKEAEEMMIRSEKMSIAGQLAAGIAHEIRNPLTSLKGFMQLMKSTASEDTHYYEIMQEELEKIENITSELLFISKPMTNDLREENLISLIQDVMTLLSSQASLYKVDIELEYDDSLSYNVHCDKSQIKQVFINLLKNAIEVMENGGEVVVHVKRAHNEYVIDVVDNGPGIPPNLIQKIKEPFFTTKKNGTGLGLMITGELLEKHNGELTILSSEHEGSTFRVSLPLE
ncbi:sporulation kinase [Pontibacillus halophilus JSM 076056 = DSM 19796]|uniref:histidine kinase n=1 Tax=Pontibacillus halophilus JSM 076056 = DSM 19796 TaxID=1385510 RepID=A0A0A5GIK4_9BACI|nr:ATP-binding protein [Pontibacillus halophilus]KGX93071.1 sporulation kinase [Pontibacillus halophilus JSM 076056 = DSM 19796]